MWSKQVLNGTCSLVENNFDRFYLLANGDGSLRESIYMGMEAVCLAHHSASCTYLLQEWKHKLWGQQVSSERMVYKLVVVVTCPAMQTVQTRY